MHPAFLLQEHPQLPHSGENDWISPSTFGIDTVPTHHRQSLANLDLGCQLRLCQLRPGWPVKIALGTDAEDEDFKSVSEAKILNDLFVVYRRCPRASKAQGRFIRRLCGKSSPAVQLPVGDRLGRPSVTVAGQIAA